MLKIEGCSFCGSDKVDVSIGLFFVKKFDNYSIIRQPATFSQICQECGEEEEIFCVGGILIRE